MDRDRAIQMAKIYDNKVAEYDLGIKDYIWNIDKDSSFNSRFYLSDKMHTDGLASVDVEKVVASYYADSKYNYIEQYKVGDDEYIPIAKHYLFKSDKVEVRDEKTQEIVETYYRLISEPKSDFEAAFSSIKIVPVCYTIYCKYTCLYGATEKSYDTIINIIINSEKEQYSEQIEKMLTNGLYVHGQAGIFDDAEKINIKPST